MIYTKLHLTKDHPPGNNLQAGNALPKCAKCSEEHKANDVNCSTYKKGLGKLEAGNKEMIQNRRYTNGGRIQIGRNNPGQK